MRIISLVVALIIAVNFMFTNKALASDTNEADTNTNINFSFKNPYNFFFNQIALADEGVGSTDSYEPIKTEDEIRNEIILNRWKAKQTEKWTNLPVGKFTINASAYTAAADETGGSGKGITSSGLSVAVNRTLACPPNFPFGAKLNIEGYGTYVCEDRGGAIKGNKIDIYMQTKAEAFQFGRRNLIAEVIQ
jgi:3D (Asp-Asp-Asp) domain-containing protein